MSVHSGSAQVTLPSDTEILITRDFAAPPAKVFAAWTTPELIRQWWTAKRGTMTVCEVDLRPGGGWRFVMHTPDGMEVGFHGEYRDVVAGERLVSTEVYEQFPGDAEAAAALNTATFTASDAGTRLELLVRHVSKEHRDMHVQSGMEDGLQDALDLIDEILSTG